VYAVPHAWQKRVYYVPGRPPNRSTESRLKEERDSAERVDSARGEDKPLEYPTNFDRADVAIITTANLQDAMEFDEGVARRNIREVRPGVEVFKLPAKSWEGIAGYLEFL